MADVPPVAPSGGEGWAELGTPVASCAEDDSVAILVVLISDFGGWGCVVFSLGVCVGVG